MTPEEFIHAIASALERRSLSLWCGAGVSWPAGLPLAGELVAAALDLLPLSAAERARVASVVPSRQPFERFMEVLLDRMSPPAQERFLGLFGLGAPAQAHVLAGQLVRRGWLRTLCTTNFDCHFESELADVADREVLDRRAQFSAIDWDRDVPRLVKLHGTVSRIAEMATTVRGVAAPGAAQAVRPVVERVFGAGDGRAVLVLGYSFSDRFDLWPPMIAAGREASPSAVYVVQHAEGVAVRDASAVALADEAAPKPLGGFRRGAVLRADTASVLDALAERLGLPRWSREKSSPAWREHLTSFFGALELRQPGLAGHLAAGALLTMVGADREAHAHHALAVQRCDELGDDRLRLGALQAYAGSALRLGDVTSARAALEQAEPLAARFDGGRQADHVQAQLGSLYHQLGDHCYLRARELYDSALAVARLSGDALRCVPHLAGIASSWMKLGDPDAARRAYEHALPIVEASGDLYRMAELHGNVGSLAYVLGDLDSADGWYMRARTAAHDAGDAENEGVHAMNLANVRVKQGRPDEALALLSEAEALLRQVLWDDHPTLALLERHRAQIVQQRDARGD